MKPKLDRSIAKRVVAWLLVLAALSAGLAIFHANSTVIGGAYGAYFGGILAALMATRARATERARTPPSPLDDRYGRKRP